MGLPTGLYFMIFPKNEDDDDGVDENTDPYSKYLGAVHVGEIPDGFNRPYFKTLFDTFDARYGEEQRPFGIDFHCLPDNDVHSGIKPSEDVLVRLILKYRALSPNQKELLDFATDIVHDLRQFLGISNVPPIANATESPKNKPTRSKKPRKPRQSKYEDAVEERLKNIVEGVNKDYISSVEFENHTTVKSIAKYLRDNDDRFKDIKIKTIEQYVRRSDAWKNRMETLQRCYGIPPPRLDEVYDMTKYKEEDERPPVSDVDCSRKEYEVPVEEYLANLKHSELLGKITRDEYISAVTNLTPKIIAKQLKEQEQFKDIEIGSIVKGVEFSDAWRNREATLDM